MFSFSGLPQNPLGLSQAFNLGRSSLGNWGAYQGAGAFVPQMRGQIPATGYPAAPSIPPMSIPAQPVMNNPPSNNAEYVFNRFCSYSSTVDSISESLVVLRVRPVLLVRFLLQTMMLHHNLAIVITLLIRIFQHFRHTALHYLKQLSSCQTFLDTTTKMN